MLFGGLLNTAMNKRLSCGESCVSAGTTMTTTSRAAQGSEGLAVTQRNKRQDLFSLHSLPLCNLAGVATKPTLVIPMLN